MTKKFYILQKDKFLLYVSCLTNLFIKKYIIVGSLIISKYYY
jgi:hypothetical protein